MYVEVTNQQTFSAPRYLRMNMGGIGTQVRAYSATGQSWQRQARPQPRQSFGVLTATLF